MIGTSASINNTNSNSYEERKVSFEAYKDTLPKEPSGDVKKEYCVGCFQKSDWDFIHIELMKDGSLEDNIPTDKCDCINDCLQSDVRGIYLLTETEADDLRNNSKVDYVHVNVNAYPGTYQQNPDDLSEVDLSYRYASTVKNQQALTSALVTNPATSDQLNRCTAQIYRHSAKKNPWVTLGNPQTVVNDRLQQYGTGVDVDVIVCDEDMWFGHIEFQDPDSITNIKTFDGTQPGQVGGSASTVAPSNFIAGNVLKSGFASSATTGTCGILDLVLDSPYYIDSAWFEADSGNRLMTRWDGTKVPVESVAREWWSDASKRSAAYSSAGTVTIPSGYTRANSNGSNTAFKTGSGFHGTPCASQAYGRQYGWAYNANKWFLNEYGTNSVGHEIAFDIQKIFHQNKPNRSSDDTKNPTVSSNSWGLRFSFNTGGGYYYYRQGASGSGGISFSSWDYDGNTDGDTGVAPRFMTNFYQTFIRADPQSGSMLTAGQELIAAGVIFVCSAGNTRQKLVDGSHPDYDNYVSSSDGTALTSSTFTSGGVTYARTINRPGMPGAIGKSGSGASTVYNTIQIGALDDTLLSGKGKKVTYSNMGQAIDCYAVADDSLAACDDQYGSQYARWDCFYTHDSSQSVRSLDCIFNGTSSACPIAAGLIATKLQYNRTWAYSNVKTWLSSNVGEQSSADFHFGTEVTTANSTAWATDNNSLQGDAAIVPYDTSVSDPPTPPPADDPGDERFSISSGTGLNTGLVIVGGSELLTISLNN